MPSDIGSVPGVTSSDGATTMADWRHRQEARREPHHAPHPHAHPHPGSLPESHQPEEAVPSGDGESAPVHHLNILA